MSNFVGFVHLEAQGQGRRVDICDPPDEPYLNATRVWNDQDCEVRHRLRASTAADAFDRQPVPLWGGQGWLVFAGRLDDRETLARALGHPPDGVADSWLAARAVERWGEKAFERFLGDFAIAAWDGRTRRLILAGDPMGNRSAYYWRRGDVVVFASSLRALVQCRCVPRCIDEEYVADFLCVNFYDTDHTFYKDVRKIAAGDCVVHTAAGVSKETFSDFDAEKRIRLPRDTDYVEAAAELVDRAMSDCLRYLGPVPISGSGGLDSATLAVSALKYRDRVPFLTIVPDPSLTHILKPGTYGDEAPRVRALAQAFSGIEPKFLMPQPDPNWTLEEMIPMAAGAIPHRVPDHLRWGDTSLAGCAALGARAFLTGGVGNLSLTWSGERALFSLLRQGQLSDALKVLFQGTRRSPKAQAKEIWRGIRRMLRPVNFSPSVVARFSCLRSDALEKYGVFERMRANGNDPEWRFSDDTRALRIQVMKRNRANRTEVLNLHRARYGMDYLAPLGDFRLISFCLAIPEIQYRLNGEPRSLGRRVLRRAGVPSVITEGNLRGQQNPEWFAHLSATRPGLPAQIERLRRNATVERLIDLDRIAHIIRNWPTDTQAQSQSGILRVGLAGALNVGSFIAWVEGTN